MGSWWRNIEWPVRRRVLAVGLSSAWGLAVRLCLRRLPLARLAWRPVARPWLHASPAQVRRALERVPPSLLGPSACLVRAVAAQQILAVCGVNARVVLATVRPPSAQSSFCAHAWIETDGQQCDPAPWVVLARVEP